MVECWIKKPSLAYRMAELDKSGIEVAKSLRIHPATFSNYANAKKPVPYALACLLAHVLGVKYADLIEERNVSNRLGPDATDQPPRTAEQLRDTHFGGGPAGEAVPA